MHAIRFADPKDALQISSLVCTLADALLVDPDGEDAQCWRRYIVIRGPIVTDHSTETSRSAYRFR